MTLDIIAVQKVISKLYNFLFNSESHLSSNFLPYEYKRQDR